ncbi:hypothetical protein PIB30_102934 [Stylosanthes scabra]|uniref:Uncharacterized protein n=1 Tax=Stylosanthes scabra TaxID=79078 RepID=A0ABU6YWT6_9FABA|nr:hypothetical protein [Stylosanthes scabra]
MSQTWPKHDTHMAQQARKARYPHQHTTFGPRFWGHQMWPPSQAHQGERAKGSLESKKKGKQSYSNSNRGLTPRRHYPCLGVAEPPSPFSLIQHPTPRCDARRLGMDKAARKMTLHQGLNA